MFNAVNNPFGQRIESAISTGQEKRQHQQNQQQNEKKKYHYNSLDSVDCIYDWYGVRCLLLYR